MQESNTKLKGLAPTPTGQRVREGVGWPWPPLLWAGTSSPQQGPQAGPSAPHLGRQRRPQSASAETGRLVGHTSEVYVRVPSLPVTWRALLHNRFPLRRKRKHLKILSFLKNLLFFESLRNSLNKTIRVNLCVKRLKWLISNDRKPSSVPSCPLRGPEK